MSQYTEPQLSSQNIIKNYQLLSSENTEQREQANRFLMSLADHEQTWVTCQSMIHSSEDPNFIFLGAQLLYQKIEKDLHVFDVAFRVQLKDFLFAEMDSDRHKKTFIIDKLASSAALISCSLFLDQWTTFMQDLTEFMRKSSTHLLSGLIILERIPEELRMTNRIPQGIKTKIQNKFMEKQQLFSVIFLSVFQLSDQQCIQRSLKAIESWIRICFPLMKYPGLVSKVLQNSIQNVQKLQIGTKVICEGLKLSSEKKFSSLSQVDPVKQQLSYSPEEIVSLKSIISFTLQNKQNFMSYVTIQPQYTQMYLQLVQQLLLSHGFLLLQDVGFQLIQIITDMTASNDLKLSHQTFDFWMDYSQKLTRMKFTDNQFVKQKIWNVFVNLLELLVKKLMIDNENLMYQADLKDDETVDDADGMTFTEYRKQSAGLLKYIYDFFVKLRKEKGSDLYFKKVGHLLQNDNPPLSRSTQLALFLLKSPLQSMIHPYETSHIISILQYLISKINSHNVLQSPIQPIVLGQTMNFIRDCTRQIKQNDRLFLQALKFVLKHINDEKLCHHAAYCFQILMETINTLNDPNIAQSLITFYTQNSFTKQVVLQKMLQGIFNAIIKVPDATKVQMYLDTILNTMIKRYMQCSKEVVGSDVDQRSELYLSLVEIKTVLDSYDSSSSNFKTLYKTKFIQLANKSISIVNQILPLGIKNKLRFSSINQVGLSISIYRVSLKILKIPENFQMLAPDMPAYLLAMQVVLMILNQKDINEYYYAMTILSQTLVQFINHTNSYLDAWLASNLNFLSNFFLQYYQHMQKVDPDVIKMFFTVHESLLLYNRNIFNHFEGKQAVLKMGLHALRHLNQRNMQRKIVNFLFLSLDNQIYAASNFQAIVQNVFASIPIIHSMCYTNLAKIFKYLFKNTTLQSKEEIFMALLSQNPFHELDQNLRSHLCRTIAFALVTEQERNIKSTFVQLTEIVWKKVNSDIIMQLQLKLATWKRQHKRSLKQKGNNTNNTEKLE